jgi:hypothetical protein
MFNFMSGGKDVIVISEMIANSSRFDPNAKENIESFAQRNGITNGQLTRDQFAAYMQERMANRMGGGRGGPGGPGGPPGMGSGNPAQDLEERAKDSFRRRDRNMDGVLNADEMPETLRAELSQWDKNHNGVIEFDEYKEYFKARIEFIREQRGGGGPGDPWQGGNGGWDGQSGQNPLPIEEDKRPSTYRVGHLPKGLPVWFEQLDTDKDGQVGLYEWKAGGYRYDDFQKWDLNADGFITVEEALRYQKVEQDRLAKAGSTGSPGMMAMGNVGPGGRGGPGGGRGGPGAWMGGPGGGSGGPPSMGNWSRGSGNGPGPGMDGGRGRGRGGPGGGGQGGGRRNGGPGNYGP